MEKIIISTDTDYIIIDNMMVAKPIYEYFKYQMSTTEIFESYGIPYTSRIF